MLTFNGVKVPSFVRVQKINVQTLPAIETNLKSIVGSSGRLSGRTTLGEKIITCDVVVVIPSNNTLQGCARELAVWLRGDDFKTSPLIISDDTKVRYMAKVNNSVELADLFVAGQGTIEFVVPSGDSEAVTENKASGTSSVTVNNTGTKIIYPVITLTVGTKVSNGTINLRNTTTGDSLSLMGSFPVGTVLTVDCNKHLVKKDGQLDISMLSLTSKFFGLKEGNNVLTCDNTGTTIVVTYRVKYL